ncbi:PREDICTED: jacalin-related lectin 48-like [Camelina sativa]|uniref:Jacalin-related lectin 48-like n=1 Tax=Camelina sativa TaxID=90675 RepID=A0ABM1RBZ0_CAMSA|nr:PREDICTED: jacalin-related lectin 48-like [Camelina sativa]
MTQRSEAQGSKYGTYKWDDGSDHDDITKIYVQYSPKGIHSISFDYVKSGNPSDGSFHGLSYNTCTQTFEINHLKSEHLESVEGYYTDGIGFQAIQFKTNLKISEKMGYHEGGTKFTLAVAGKKIIGFHGSFSVETVDSLGAYFTLITPTKMEAKGSKEGKEWDDGVDQVEFTKIHVRSGPEGGIQYIKFEYVDKDGQLKDGPIHGSISRRGSPHVFEIKHAEKEYLVSVEGFCDGDDEYGVIQALQFKTNIKTSELMGSYTATDKKFRLWANGMKIVGFHGYAKTNLSSLGAYFTPLIPTKGGCRVIKAGGTLWDDGAFKGVRKVSVIYGSSYIRGLRINYDNDGKVEKHYHGRASLSYSSSAEPEGEFMVDYPNEFITSVVVTINSNEVTSLTYKTSKGRTSQTFGSKTSDSSEFVLESKGCVIVGFHGVYHPYEITGLGAYFYPMPLPPAAEKLEAQGGAGGSPWDDGSNFEGVRNIYIGTGEIGIVSVKFLYENDTHEIVVGDHHGNKNLLGHDEFKLDYPCEYLTSVEGSYDVVPGSEEFEVILMLKFTTNKRTSPSYGLDDDPSFVLHKEGHKIVGFHGKSSNMLHQLGIHVLPITTS